MSNKKIDYTILPDEMKREFFLTYDNYKNCKSVSELKGVAQLINTLLLLKPGTYPNSPEMGINIKKYQFELIDEQRKDEIRDEIIDQIRKYIMSSAIVQLSLNVFEHEGNMIMGLAFSISSIEANMVENFLIFAKQSKLTKDINTFLSI